MLVACSGEPAGHDWTRCQDAACWGRELPAAWKADADAVKDQLRDLDPVAQEAALRALAAHFPQGLDGLCPELAPPADQVCQRLRERPHLAMQAPRSGNDPIPTRHAPGPSGAHLPRPPLPAGTTGLESLAGTPVGQQAAACEGNSGSGPGAVGECRFQLAEALVREKGFHAWPQAMVLCESAVPFVMPCAQHVLSLAVPVASPSDAPGRKAISGLAQAEQFISQAVGPDLAPLYVDRMRAIWVATAFRSADDVTGHLLTALPPDAAPHVRMAAAWTLLLREGPRDGSLDGLVAELERRLAITGPVLDEAPERAGSALSKPIDRWPEDGAVAEQSIPAVSCLGESRRALGATVQEDLQISILEAAARLEPPPPRTLFDDALQPTRSPVVRWTAVRLARALYGPQGWPEVPTPGADGPPGGPAGAPGPGGAPPGPPGG